MAGPLEDEVQRILDKGQEASSAGSQPLSDPQQVIDFILPMLAAHQKAILRLARKLDESS